MSADGRRRTSRPPGSTRRPSGARRPAGRTSARPAGAAGPRTTYRPRSGATGATRVARGAFARRSTRRLAVLGGVFVLLAIMLVPPLRAYLVQQQEYSDLQSKVARQEQSLTDLQARTERWNDPVFVEQQARERLQYVRPGETAYTVVGAEALLDHVEAGRISVVNPAQRDASSAWYARMWESAQLVDRLDTDPVAARVTSLEGPKDPRARHGETPDITPGNAPTSGEPAP